MESIRFVADPSVIAPVLGCCGSLAAPAWGPAWQKLAPAILTGRIDLAADAAHALTAEAIPEEGEYHPHRASFGLSDDGISALWFATPGGVVVELRAHGPDALLCDIEFNRDSVHLSRQMLGVLAERAGGRSVVVADCFPMPVGVALAISALRSAECEYADEAAASLWADVPDGGHHLPEPRPAPASPWPMRVRGATAIVE